MYFVIVVALMLVLPTLSIGIDASLVQHQALNALIVGKWFVFWGVGIRLLLAGLRQIIQPRYTAETILGVKDPDATLIVRELGIANTAMGSAAAASLVFPGWVSPMAVVGAIFYGMAGINHVRYKNRNTLQSFAMVSDLLAAGVLIAFCVASFTRHRVARGLLAQ